MEGGSYYNMVGGELPPHEIRCCGRAKNDMKLNERCKNKRLIGLLCKICTKTKSTNNIIEICIFVNFTSFQD